MTDNNTTSDATYAPSMFTSVVCAINRGPTARLTESVSIRAAPNKIAMAKYSWNVPDQMHVFGPSEETVLAYLDTYYS